MLKRMLTAMVIVLALLALPVLVGCQEDEVHTEQHIEMQNIETEPQEVVE